MLSRIMRLWLFLSLALLATGANAQQVLFDNTNGLKYSATACYTARGPAAFGESSYVAFAFTPSINATLASIEIAVKAGQGSAAIHGRLAADANGLPGTSLVDFSLPPPPSEGGFVTMRSTERTLLAPDSRYWLYLAPTGDADIHWLQCPTGLAGPAALSGIGLWSAPPGGLPQAAFRVTGLALSAQAGAAAAATPEPGAIGVAGALLCAALGTQWKRRR